MTTFDLDSVRHFTADLTTRLATCNGEGMYCSDLDQSIRCHADLCGELRVSIDQWASAVFFGTVAFDPAVEAVFLAELQHVLTAAQSLAELGRKRDNQCFRLAALPHLHYSIADLSHLRDNWVSPALAASAAARATPARVATPEILDRLSKLPPLPKDWQPQGHQQAAEFSQAHK